MVMGIDSAISFLEKHQNLDAYFIYSEENKMKTYATKGLKTIITD